MFDILYHGGILAALMGLTGLGYQLSKMIKTRNTKAVSYHLSIWLAASMALWVGFGIHLNEPVIYISNIIGVVISVGIFITKLLLEKE